MLVIAPLEVEDVELDHSNKDDGVTVEVDDDVTGEDCEILESDDDEQFLGLEDSSIRMWDMKHPLRF